jgi:glycosyltransferase involved in cell wall biosynthesis
MATATVIIATYNRSALLDECLAHLARQQFLPVTRS